MGIFGWDLPPGVSMRDIERAYGEETPTRCAICQRWLAGDNMTGTCPKPRPCAATLAQRYKEEDDAEARAVEESDRWEEELKKLDLEVRDEDRHS